MNGFDRPDPMPTRRRVGIWEVLMDDWMKVATEEEAKILAGVNVLKYDALERRRSGEEFATELERAATVLERYRRNFASRSLRQRAVEARERVQG